MLDFNIELTRGRFDLDISYADRFGVLGVFGPSGSGKTTLLHSLAGLLTPDRGRIDFAGQTLYDSASRTNVPACCRPVGLVFQDHRLFPHKTVRGNLRYGMRRGEESRFSIDDISRMLEIEHLLDRSARKLSGGQAARVALARAILASPKLLLLDEPFAGLDIRLKNRLLPLLLRVRRRLDLPMVVVSHDFDVHATLADRLLAVADGRAVGRGDIFDLVQNPRTLPLLDGHTISSSLRLTVVEHRPAEGFTLMRNIGRRGPIIKTRPEPALPVGATVDATLPSGEVVLALDSLENSSMQNQLRVKIDRITTNAGRVFCQLDIGLPILAEVTAQSAEQLGLCEGRPVWCLFKATSMRCHWDGRTVDSGDNTATSDSSHAILCDSMS